MLPTIACLVAGAPLLSSSPVLAQKPAPAKTQRAAIATPPPISGRRISDPESINPADILARLRLAHDNFDQIRAYIGLDPAPPPFFKVKNVSTPEAFFASLNLTRRGNQLLFEQLRVLKQFDNKLPSEPTAFDVYKVVDEVLITALEIKAEIGIPAMVSEKPAPESTTMTDVFNQVLTSGALISHLLEKKTRAREVHFILTVAVRQAMELHQKMSTSLMPEERPFIPGKSPTDAYREIERSYDLVVKIAKPLGLPILTFESNNAGRKVTPDDVFELALVVVAELDRLIQVTNTPRPPELSASLGPKFPAHSLQRAHLLRAILRDILAGQK